jgi:arylsulfatase
VSTPKSAPNVLIIMTDDQGYASAAPWRRGHPTPSVTHREGRAPLHPVQLDGAVLTDACSADHRPQSPFGRHRRHHRAVDRLPGYDSIIGLDNASIGEILKENGYATSWFGKNHNTPAFQYSVAGPFDQWPSGMGFDYFYGFMGGETDQWEPYLFRDHTQIFPWIGKPGYNLTTDMADEAITYLKQLEAARRANRSSFITFPAAVTRRTSRRRSGSPSSKASSTWAGMPCANRSSRIRRRPA